MDALADHGAHEILARVCRSSPRLRARRAQQTATFAIAACSRHGDVVPHRRALMRWLVTIMDRAVTRRV
jgi:hypothetical protein